MEAFPLVFALFPMVFVGVVVLGIVLLVRGRAKAQQRRSDLAVLAAQRGWTFRPDGHHLISRFPGEPFGRGHARRAGEVVEGMVRGWHFVAFDYVYRTSGGHDNSDDVHRFSVLAVNLGCRVPRLQVKPQSALGRFFADSFGTDYRIGQQAFDDAFHIATDSPRFAHDVLHPGMTQLLLASRGRAVRFQDDSLLLFRSGSHSPQEIEAVLGLMVAILDQVPQPVWEELHGDTGPQDRRV